MNRFFDRWPAARVLLAILAGLTAMPALAPGQTATVAADDSLDAIVKRVAALDAEIAKSPDDKFKPQVRDWYRQAAEHLKAAERVEAAKTELEKKAACAASQTKRIQQDLDRLAAKSAQDWSPYLDEAALESMLAQAKTCQLSYGSSREELEKERNEWAKSQQQLPQARAKLEVRADEIEKQLPVALDGEPEEAAAARKTALRTERRLVQVQLAKLKLEAAVGEDVKNLLELQLKLATRENEAAAGRVKLLQQDLNRLRQDTALKLRAAARRRWEEESNAALKPQAETNFQLADERIGLIRKISKVDGELEERTKQLSDLNKRFERTRRDIEDIGVTHNVAAQLRRQRAGLRPAEHRQSLEERQLEIHAARKLLDKRGDELKDLEEGFHPRTGAGPLASGLLNQALAAQSSGEPSRELESVRGHVREYLAARHAHLQTLGEDYDRYITRLLRLNVEQEKLLKETERYAGFINERILWGRSNEPLSSRDVSNGARAALWLLGPQAWRDVAGALMEHVRSPSVAAIVCLIVFIPWLAAGTRLRRRIADVGRRASLKTCQDYWPTMEVFCYTALLAALYPALLGFLAWLLSSASSGVAPAAADGLAAVVWALAPLEFFRQICRGGGLARAHFEWPDGAAALVRRRIWQLLFLGLPLLYIAAAMNEQGEEAYRSSLGRAAFIVLMLLTGLVFHSLLRPNGAVFQQVMAMKRAGWWFHLRWAVYLTAVLGCLTLAVLSAVGYYDTAWQLANCLQATVHLALGLLVADALVLRWIRLSHRKLAIEQRRQTAREQAGQPTATDAAGIVAEAPPHVDLPAVSEQTRRLLNVSLVIVAVMGLWLIWSSVLPALNVVMQVSLWSTTVAGNAQQITLGHLTLAVLLFVLTVIATRNLPGLLQMAVLQRLPIDPAVRYAVHNVSRYVITIIGVVIAFNAIGIGWEKIQWLVAAISVGLGFGLQEIFANFVSGLIILFEQPIRVGDVVTIDGTTGVVSKIRIRATTITNWDRQELIIPNKEFITGKLLNWTLSDKVNRVMVNVGVAYGSDTRRATELLLGIAAEHPQVLADPQPRVTFETFGDSTLNFVMRVYLSSLDNRLDTIHELHTAIHDKFAAEGIEIAFPQRDLHIRTMVETSGNSEILE